MSLRDQCDNEILHFVGIGGSGMAPLAKLALCRGYRVTGSDTKQTRTTEELQELGVKLVPENDMITLGQASQVVFSSAIPEDHSARTFARSQKKKLLHRSELLQSFMKEKIAITVAGAHGKTTTSALIGHILKSMRAEPTLVFGGQFADTKQSMLHGSGKYFVAEADESDGSFLNYRPYLAVVTNVEADHLEHYGSEKNLLRAYEKHLELCQVGGTIIVSESVKHQLRLPESRTVLTAGVSNDSDVQVKLLKHSESHTEVAVRIPGRHFTCKLPMVGAYNLHNAALALATAFALELNMRKAIESLESFPGVHRRMTILHKQRQRIIVDDYAHNPGKIRSAIAALRATWPTYRLCVVFQAPLSKAKNHV